MAVCNEVTALTLGRYLTLSADYYYRDYLDAQNTIHKINSIYPLAFFCKSEKPITYGVLKPRDVDEGSYKLARIQNSEGLFIYGDDLPSISGEQFAEYIRSEVTTGDIVIAIGGYIGPLGIICNTNKCRININRHLARISPNIELIDPYYLLAYLSCDISQKLLKREIRGAVQAGINIADLKLHPIYCPEEKIQHDVGNIMRDAETKIHKAKSLYTQAQQLLEQELGLDKLMFEKPVGYEASFSEVINNNRADADYYQIKYLQIRKTIKKYYNGWKSLLNVANAYPPNIDPYKTPEKEFCYIELSDINSNLNIVSDFKAVLGKNLPTRAKRIVNTGDIISSSVVGSIEKTAIIGRDKNNFIASTGFFHFRPINIPSEYLLILLRSSFVQEQFKQQASGGILSAVSELRLKHIIVPDIDTSIQNMITQLVKKSHQAEQESHRLLEKAKTRVEQLIEQAAEKP